MTKLIGRTSAELTHTPNTNVLSIRNLFWDALGRDRSVAWINVTTLWSLARGPVAAFMIITCLSDGEQGLWYAFSNLGAFSVFAELGFSVIISQFVSHEFAKLELRSGRLGGDDFHLDRLVSLVRCAIKMYGIVILVAIFVLSMVGFFYFKGHPETVFAAWVFFSMASGFSLFANLVQGIYRGMNQVESAQRTILVSSVVATLTIWIGLLLDIGIWALPIGSLSGGLVLLSLLSRMAPELWLQLYHHEVSHQFSWAREVGWLQGRYAVTFACGYFTFNLMVPAVFKFEGAVPAGQLGLTLALTVAVQSFALASLNAWVPKVNMLIAANREQECWELIKKLTVVGSALFLVGAGFLLITPLILQRLGYGGRLLDVPVLSLVILYHLATTFASAASTFLRAHKREPHMPIAIVQAAIIGTSMFTILPRFGLFWLLIAVNISFWIIAVPAIIWMAFNCKSKLQSVAVGNEAFGKAAD